MEFFYSIDKVRMKVRYPVCSYKVNGLLIEGVADFMKKYEYDICVDYKYMTRFDSYAHNFNFTDINSDGDECRIWLGIGHNSLPKDSSSLSKIDVTIEFNPNKCVGSLYLRDLLDKFFKDNKMVEVKSFDVAIDIPINISNLKPVLRGNRCYKPQFYGGDNQTHYIGARNSDGHIKIYNKSRERGIKGVDLTRYEVTVKPDTTIDNMCGLYGINPGLFIDLICVSCQFDFNLTGTDKVLLLACMEHPEYLKELSRDKQKKIKQLLADNCSISFDYIKINSVINDYFKTIYTI